MRNLRKSAPQKIIIKRNKLKISPLMTTFYSFALKIEINWANKVIKGSGQFPRIAGNVRNHGNKRKFYKSHQILNQTKWNLNKLGFEKTSLKKTWIPWIRGFRICSVVKRENLETPEIKRKLSKSKSTQC